MSLSHRGMEHQRYTSRIAPLQCGNSSIAVCESTREEINGNLPAIKVKSPTAVGRGEMKSLFVRGPGSELCLGRAKEKEKVQR